MDSDRICRFFQRCYCFIFIIFLSSPVFLMPIYSIKTKQYEKNFEYVDAEINKTSCKVINNKYDCFVELNFEYQDIYYFYNITKTFDYNPQPGNFITIEININTKTIEKKNNDKYKFLIILSIVFPSSSVAIFIFLFFFILIENLDKE